MITKNWCGLDIHSSHNHFNNRLYLTVHHIQFYKDPKNHNSCELGGHCQPNVIPHLQTSPSQTYHVVLDFSLVWYVYTVKRVFSLYLMLIWLEKVSNRYLLSVKYNVRVELIFSVRGQQSDNIHLSDHHCLEITYHH